MDNSQFDIEAFKADAVSQGYDERVIDRFLSGQEAKNTTETENLNKYVTAVEGGFGLDSVPSNLKVDVFNSLKNKGVDVGDTSSTVVNELRSGVPLKEIISRHPEVDPTDLANLNTSIWGPLNESEAIQRQMGIDPTKIRGASPAGEEKAPEEKAVNAINVLEELYGRGNGMNVGTNKDLSTGQSWFGKGSRAVRSAAEKTGLFQSDQLEDWRKYQSQTEIVKGLLTQAMGAGAPTGDEPAALLRSMPNLSSTNEEAKEWFKRAKQLISGTMTESESIQKEIDPLEIL